MKYGDFPASVRKAIGFLWAGWISHCLFVYVLFSGQSEAFPTTTLYQQMAIGAVLGFFFFRIKRWARLMGMLFNAAAVLILIPVAVLFYAMRPMISLFSIFNVGLFSLAIYFMAIKETSSFFRAANPVDPVRGQDDHS